MTVDEGACHRKMQGFMVKNSGTGRRGRDRGQGLMARGKEAGLESRGKMDDGDSGPHIRVPTQPTYQPNIQPTNQPTNQPASQ